MGLGGVGEHQVAVLLVGVGLLRVGLDDDEAGEDGLRGVEQGVFVEQVRGGVGRDVGLERALVELLGAGGDGEGQHLGVRAGAEEAGVRLVAGLAAAEVEVEGEHAGVALGGDGVDLKGEGFGAPVLRADVGELRALGGMEVVDAGGELAFDAGTAADEELDQGGLGAGAEHDDGVREGGDVGAGEGVLDDEGQGDLDVGGHVEEGAAGAEGGVERDKLFRAEVGRMFLQVGLHEVAVIAQGLVERGEDDAFGGEFGGDGAAADELAVGVDDFGGVREIGQVGDLLRGVLGQGEAVEVEALEIGVAPGFVGAGREREGVELVPRGLLGLEPPGGQVGALGEMLGEAGGIETGEGGRGGECGSGHAEEKG